MHWQKEALLGGRFWDGGLCKSDGWEGNCTWGKLCGGVFLQRVVLLVSYREKIVLNLR